MDYKFRSLCLSPVHVAVVGNNEQNLKKLIQLKIDVNVVWKNELNTPLIEACKRGNINMIKDLLKANAIVFKPNIIGKTADQYLDEFKNLNRSKLIRDNMLDVFELYIEKLKKRKIKEQMIAYKIRFNQEYAEQKRKIKEKEVELKEKNKKKTSIGFKKIV